MLTLRYLCLIFFCGTSNCEFYAAFDICNFHLMAKRDAREEENEMMIMMFGHLLGVRSQYRNGKTLSQWGTLIGRAIVCNRDILWEK